MEIMELLNTFVSDYIVVMEGDFDGQSVALWPTIGRGLVALVVAFLVIWFTVGQVVLKILQAIVNWMAAGVPVGYPEYNGPEITFIND